jgi:RNA polymerase sigma-70 factor (ECF subfamily)
MEDYYYLHPIDTQEPDMEKVLADCIERLKDDQKKCIVQFYYEDKCYDEIAKNLGVDEKKVKSYLQNGKRNLKLCIEEKNERKKQKQE